MRRFFSILLLGVMSAACGSGGPRLPQELLDAIGGGGAGAISAGYPPPPYGAEIGDTLEDACFEEAWLNPVAENFALSGLREVCFSHFHDPDGGKNTRVLLINTGALWCSACRTEWPWLLKEHDELGPRGFVAFGLFFQDAESRPASQTAIEAWARLFSVDVPFGRDPEFKMGKYARANAQPFNMLVDTRSMKILNVYEGEQNALIGQTIRSHLDQGLVPSNGK